MRRIMATLCAGPSRVRIAPDRARSVSAQERILLVRLSHLGDVVHALPVYHALREGFPDARIAWAVQREFAPLLEGLAGLELCLPFDRRGGAHALLELHARLGAFAPTLAVDAQGNLKSALVTLASGAPRRVGMARADWREPLGASVLTEQAARASSPTGVPHAMDRMLALARHLAPQASLRTDPGLSDDERARGRALLAQHAPPGPGPLAVLQVARAGDVRSWPIVRIEELARGLLALGWRVLALSGPEERAEGAELARRLPADSRLRHWVGQRGLRELAALLTAAAQARARFVGCDSGPMHLAIACGLRVVALAGPQDPRRTGPWPVPDEVGGAQPAAHESLHRVVRAQDPPSCAPCLARSCSHPQGPVCMASIEPGAVLAALAASD
jgi:heptosyltransferase-1